MAEKVIGILGGMGPEATLDCFEKIIKNTSAEKDQEHLRVLIDCNPKIPDRTAAICENGESPVPILIDGAHKLTQAGADFIIIPCVSAHFFLNQLRRQIHIPILSIIDAVTQAIHEVNPPIQMVGLLATTGTIQGSLFQNRLKQNKIATIIPGKSDQDKVMAGIYKIKATQAGDRREKIRIELLNVANSLIKKGAEGIIAGCTEVPLTIGPEDMQVPFFDPLRILARAAIREAGCKPRYF
ncbi:MAG: amino acid racemase [Desulfobacterales bacterium]|jgi:aspartate racemase